MQKVSFEYRGPGYCCPERCSAFEPELITQTMYADFGPYMKIRTVECKNREVCEKLTKSREAGIMNADDGETSGLTEED